MPKPLVSLVVPVSDPGSRLTPLVRWVDGQTLPYSNYQVIYLDQGSTDATPQRLAALAHHRPNVTVVTVTGTAAGSGIAEALNAAEGEFTLVLGREDRLHPWSLSALVDAAERDGSDVVLGRNAGMGPVGFTADALMQPWEAHGPDAAIAMLAPAALIRTRLLQETYRDPDLGWRSVRSGLASAAVSILSDLPVAVGPGLGAGESVDTVWSDLDVAAERVADPVQRARLVAAHAFATVRRSIGRLSSGQAELIADVVRRHTKDVDQAAVAPAHRGILAAVNDDGGLEAARNAVADWTNLKLAVSTDRAEWVDGRLELAFTVSLRSGQTRLPSGIDEVAPFLMLRDPASWAVFRPDAEVRIVTAEAELRRFQLSASLDVSTAAAGDPLPQGMWQLQIRLRGSGSDAPATKAVAHRAVTGALVDGVPVRPYEEDGQLRLDVGAKKHGLWGSYQPVDASVSESSDGSLLTVRLTDVAHRGDARLPGHLYLGNFGLPATLIADSQGPRIECWVSGLAGVSRLSGLFPPATRQPLGLQLRISPAGDMAVESVPAAKPATPKPATPKPAAPKPAAPKPADTPKQQSATTPAGGPVKAAGSAEAAQPKAASASPTAAVHSVGRTVLPMLKPAGALLPRPLRRRARRLYRRLTK